MKQQTAQNSTQAQAQTAQKGEQTMKQQRTQEQIRQAQAQAEQIMKQADTAFKTVTDTYTAPKKSAIDMTAELSAEQIELLHLSEIQSRIR